MVKEIREYFAQIILDKTSRKEIKPCLLNPHIILIVTDMNNFDSNFIKAQTKNCKIPGIEFMILKSNCLIC